MGAPNDATHAVTGREVLPRTTSVICCTHGNMSRGLARTTAVREKRYMAWAPSMGEVPAAAVHHTEQRGM
jgi:hypothetical protein